LLNEIRKNFTPSLGKDHGRVVLKAAKPHLVARLAEFRAKLDAHQKTVAADLQKHLDASREQVVAYYLARVMESRPDALLGQSLNGAISEDSAKKWINGELDRVFPTADSLIHEMKLEERYKDVTFETLNRGRLFAVGQGSFPDCGLGQGVQGVQGGRPGRQQTGRAVVTSLGRCNNAK
jgi:hypothetical protein